MTASIRDQLALAPVMLAPPRVAGLDPDEQLLLDRLFKLWAAKRPRNLLRQLYADGHVKPKNLGISVPDDVAEMLGVVVGWPAKAVFGLADRCIWDGAIGLDGSEDPFELDIILDANQFGLEIDQVIASALTQSVAFITVTPGDATAGEPEVAIAGHSAQWASALWDRPRRRLLAGMTINDVDGQGQPVSLTLYTASEVVHCATAGAGWYPAAVWPHRLGRVPMEALPYEPSLDRPMGRSRITRDVMSITQRAMRTILREDIAQELFTVPGMLLRGVDKETFEQIHSWTWRAGAVKGISRDEEGDVPEVDWTPQASTQPFVEQLRELAAEFAGATSLPLSSLGVIQDNPSSAEAIAAAKEDLVIKAQRSCRTWDSPIARVYQDAVMIRDGLAEAPEELRRVRTRWGDPAKPSVVSQADAVSKQIAAIPWIGESTVALEALGYSEGQIRRLLADKRRAEAGATLDKLAALAQPEQQPVTEEPEAEAPGQGGLTT